MSTPLHELMSVQAAEGTDTFLGQPDHYGAMGIYGGHFVGQGLAAAFETVDEPKLAHSAHCYFLRPGDPESPLHWQVTRLREGRGSDVRTVTANQHGRDVFQMTASFKLAEEGDEHQPAMPDVEPPESILERQEKSAFTPPMAKHGRTEMLLASEHFIQNEFTAGRDAMLRMWTRCPQRKDLSEREAQIALAFLSDGTLMFNSVIPHGLPFQTHRLTSIDHAVWFHRGGDVADWMLFDQHSTNASDGRGMNHGHLFDRNGRLLLTTVQESMLRKIKE